MTNRRITGLKILLTAALVLVFCSACGGAELQSAGDARLTDTAADNAAVASVLPEETDNPEESLLVSSLRISELMPSNQSSVKNADGERADWVEIENTGSVTVQLSGCWLSDDYDNLQKWEFPDIEMPEGGRIVVFCSEEAAETEELQADFNLDKNGGELVLSSPYGRIIDSVSYEDTDKDASAVFMRGGKKLPEPEYTFLATPGFDNSPEGYEEYLYTADKPGKLAVNEAVTYNRSYSKQSGEYYDWIELKNISSDSVLLSDYYLSDDCDSLQKTQLPAVTLKAGETFMVFCSGDGSLTKKTAFHADFSIGTEEHIYLTGPDGAVSDEIYIHDVPLNGSIGRMTGENGFWYFAKPSPEKENADGYREISGQPAASLEQGVYSISEPIELELEGEGGIYYTTDGSVPDLTDTRYVSPIEITETAVIRAVCIEDGKMAGPVCTYSYIINEGDTLPVTSLVCEPDEMFGGNGVYKASREQKARCDADVSFFDINGDGFSAGCSVELHGARSRTSFKKKSFELKFSSRYGGDVEYDLFQDGNVTEFHSLLLRGGSSVRMDTVRDCFVSELMYDVSPELYPQDVRYTAVYINGEYYGIYAWREAYSEEYFESHTGADKDEVQIVRGPLGASAELWGYFYAYIKGSSDMDTRYAELSEKVDLSSLARWLAVEAYFNNQDINGNIRYVKAGSDAKWQVILYDLDYCCLDSHPSWNCALSSYQLGDVVCRTLMRNDSFKELLLEECSKLYKNGFQTENIQRIYDDLLKPLDDESVEKDCKRWGDGFSKWGKYTKAMRNNMDDSRMAEWLKQLKQITDATDEQMHGYFPEYY